MPRCKHDKGNIQSYREICLDCGHNIYETDAEYEASLRKEIYALQDQTREKRIESLEEIKRQLEKELYGDDDDNKTNW